MDDKNELEKKLVDKWSLTLDKNPCNEVPLGQVQPAQLITVDIAKMLENQNTQLKNMYLPPDEPTPENIDEYEKEMSKNLLVGHFCDNCYYSSCEKEHKNKYGTCSVWKTKEDGLFGGLNLGQAIFPIIRRAYPTLIANDIISVQPIIQNPINPVYVNSGSNCKEDLIMDDPEPELTDEQIAERNRLEKMTPKQKKRERKPRWNTKK